MKESQLDAISLAFEIPDDDCPTIVDVHIYADDKFGYYDRVATYCSDRYHSVFRFNREDFPKVIEYVNENQEDLSDIEGFLQNLDGYEWLLSDR